MRTKHLAHITKLIFIISLCLLGSLPLVASASQVSLQWDANDPVPDGYRLYQRSEGGTFDYDNPVWTGTDTTAMVSDLTVGDSYYFVVRAFVGSEESGDSNEVAYKPTAPETGSDPDSDGDGWSDTADAFPLDATEWLDTDADGVGNNADEDDDDDGMPDIWENQFDGLDALVDDADQDLDNDGISNIDEYLADSDPSNLTGNQVPDKPLLSQPVDKSANVSLTPILMPQPYSDPDGDSHARTCYQISTDEDFSTLVFEKTSSVQKNGMRISEMILDPDTTYHWRIKFIDEHNGASEWSEPFSFVTIDHEAAGDLDGDGILDDQIIDEAVDLDGNGKADYLQSGLQAVTTNDALNPHIAVKNLDTNAILAGVRALDVDDLNAGDNQSLHFSGVISFKLMLKEGAKSTTVTIYLSQPAPANARWYKYDPDSGWRVYEYAVFDESRTAVTISLEDGGEGDEDGVVNGIIVDPSGLGYSQLSNSTPDASVPVPVVEAAGGGCFISVSAENAEEIGWMDKIHYMGIMVLLLVAGMTGGLFLRRVALSIK